MNKNTVFLIAAGVAAYLIWKKLNKASPVSGIGQTVDWHNLATPGMSLGPQRPGGDDSIFSPLPLRFRRSRGLSEFNSVEAIGAAEFSGHESGILASEGQIHGDGLGMMPSVGRALPPLGSGMSMGRVGPMLPPLGQNAGMSLGKVGPMLPPLGRNAGMSMGKVWGMLPRLSTGAPDPSIHHPYVTPPPDAPRGARPLPYRSFAGSPTVHGGRLSMEPDWHAEQEDTLTPPPGSAPAPEAEQGAEYVGSDSWGGDAGTSTDMVQIAGGQMARVI